MERKEAIAFGLALLGRLSNARHALDGAAVVPGETKRSRRQRHHLENEVLGDPRLYVCQAPNAFICVSPCGSILGPFGVHFGSIRGPFWVHFGSILLVEQESVFRQESTTRQESVFRQECSLDKKSSLDC